MTDLCKYCFRLMNSHYLNSTHIHICKKGLKDRHHKNIDDL